MTTHLTVLSGIMLLFKLIVIHCYYNQFGGTTRELAF